MASTPNRDRFIAGLGSLVLWLGAQTVYGHHGFTNHFDPDQERTISGSVTRFDFVNPHVKIYVDVENDRGETEHWLIESGGTSGFLSSGRMSADSLQPGDHVEIVGHPSRHNEFEMRANRLVLPDGSEVTMRNPYEPVPFLQNQKED